MRRFGFRSFGALRLSLMRPTCFLAAQITSQSGFENALLLQQDDFEIGLLPKISYVRPDKLITLNE